jgi:hypothetical protein
MQHDLADRNHLRAPSVIYGSQASRDVERAGIARMRSAILAAIDRASPISAQVHVFARIDTMCCGDDDRGCDQDAGAAQGIQDGGRRRTFRTRLLVQQKKADGPVRFARTHRLTVDDVALKRIDLLRASEVRLLDQQRDCEKLYEKLYEKL